MDCNKYLKKQYEYFVYLNIVDLDWRKGGGDINYILCFQLTLLLIWRMLSSM